MRNQHARLEGDALLDNQDLIGMFKVSRRTLQRYRSQGELPYCNLSAKSVYKLTDVQRLLTINLLGINGVVKRCF